MKAKVVAPSPGRLWLMTAAAVAAHNIVMVYATQSATTALMSCLVWFGALVCIEGRLQALRLEPHPLGMGVGFALILWGIWRSHQVFHTDAVVFVLALAQGVGLTLFLVPPSRMKETLASLSVLACMGITLAISVFPTDLLSIVTARLTQGILILFLQSPDVAGPEVWLFGRGVRISGSCSGTETIAQLFAVAVIFTLAFPLRKRVIGALMVLMTLPLALLVNSFRISLLAFLNSQGWDSKRLWFDFFHERSGSLVFSAIAVGIFGWIYLRLIERQLRPREK